MTFNEGDQVYVIMSLWSDSIRKGVVSRVTKTQAIVGSGDNGIRFNRQSGRIIGGSGYSTTRIEHHNPSLDALYKKRQGEALAAKLSAVALQVSRGEIALTSNLYAAIQNWIRHEEGEK